MGFLQEFADGSAGYWKVPGEKATPASSVADAIQRLFPLSAVARARTSASLNAGPQVLSATAQATTSATIAVPDQKKP
jgi:hypothetical protein